MDQMMPIIMTMLGVAIIVIDQVTDRLFYNDRIKWILIGLDILVALIIAWLHVIGVF